MTKKPYASALADTANASMAAGADAFITIAFRMPLLMAAPSARTTAEWNRAWNEKMAASFKGAVDATVALQGLALRVGTGGVAAEHLPSEMLAVHDAATRPGYRTVAANAKRLTRRSSRA